MNASQPTTRLAAWGGATLLALVIVTPVGATNGYFSHGYGTANKALAGAGVALPGDALTVATNPAGMAFVGKRYDFGVAIFNPNREYEIIGEPTFFPGTFGLIPGTVQSDSETFLIPHFGANWEVGPNATFGVAVYGHGGLNTDYPASTFYAGSPTGVNLSQLFVAPVYARRFGPGGNHAFGIAPLLVYQQFEAKGVGSFADFSQDPTRLSNNGNSDSLGYGFKLGYLGRFSDRFSVGVAYQSEIAADRFEEYAGLFAGDGDFNIPSSVTAGIAVGLTDRVTWVLDVQEIYYSDIESVGNPLFPNLLQAPLGNLAGAGFGWQDMTVLKTGVEISTDGDWTWRLGFSTGDQPIPESEVLFNILAPGVMDEHLTAGFTKDLAGGNRALNLSLMRAFSNSVQGPNPLEAPGAQEIRLTMDQWELEVSYSWGM